MNRVCLWRAAALAALLPFLAAAHDHGEQWILVDADPATSLPGEGDELFAKAVRDATEGRISIITMPDAKMGLRSRDHLRAVASGKVAMANTYAGALMLDEPVFRDAAFPLVGADTQAVRRYYDDARPSLAAAFGRHNQKLLWTTPWPPPARVGSVTLSFTTVNLERWNALDDDTRRAIERAASRTEARQWSALDEWARKR
jgi:TRAP-type C4-dicarboxylate transport system substrate-binding protein